jgi:uncharacterized protein YggE
MKGLPLIFPYQRFWLALLIGSFLNLAWMNNTGMAQESVLRTLTVTGVGIEKIPTTLTQVSLGIEVQGTTAGEVQQEVAERTSALVTLLRSRQVKQLQTIGIRLQPNYAYRNQERQLIGYIGTNTVSFRLETEQVGKLLDEAVKTGATRIDGVSFTATEEALAAAQQGALRQATLNAQQQADTILKYLNLIAREIVNIQVNGASIPPPRPTQIEQPGNATGVVSMPIIGGEQTVTASVTLQVRY